MIKSFYDLNYKVIDFMSIKRYTCPLCPGILSMVPRECPSCPGNFFSNLIFNENYKSSCHDCNIRLLLLQFSIICLATENCIVKQMCQNSKVKKCVRGAPVSPTHLLDILNTTTCTIA